MIKGYINWLFKPLCIDEWRIMGAMAIGLMTGLMLALVAGATGIAGVAATVFYLFMAFGLIVLGLSYIQISILRKNKST